MVQHIYARPSDPSGLVGVSEAAEGHLVFPSFEDTGQADPELGVGVVLHDNDNDIVMMKVTV